VQHRSIVVVARGEANPAAALALVPLQSTVVAADSGVDHALALGLHVDIAVGDFDSVTPAGLAAAEAAGARMERHPAAKDKTDLELALDTARAFGPGRILVLGDDGGRLDHLLAALLLLGAGGDSNSLLQGPERAPEVDALLGRVLVHVVPPERTLAGTPGEILSLVPLHGPAEGVVTEGLHYPLHGETLAPGSSRGISNVFAEPQARISLERGVLLAIRPGREGGDA
jgi:thiamine pyrophosphokinase